MCLPSAYRARATMSRDTRPRRAASVQIGQMALQDLTHQSGPAQWSPLRSRGTRAHPRIGVLTQVTDRLY